MEHFKRLLGYSKKYAGLNVFGLVLVLGVIITGLYLPMITRSIVDDVLVDQQFGMLKSLIISMVFFTLLRAMMQYLRSYIFEYTSQKVLYDFRSQLYSKLQLQSYTFYDKERTGTLMNRMVGDLQAVRQMLNSGYVQMFEGTISIAMTLYVMVSLSWKLTLTLIFIVPLTALSMRAMSKRLRPVYRLVRDASENLSSYVQENIAGIQVVKAFGREDYEIGRFEDITQDFNERNIEAADIRSNYIPVSRITNGLSTVIIMLLGGYLVMQGEITLGILAAFADYMQRLINPINNATQLVNQWENAKASLEKIFGLLDEESIMVNAKDAQPLTDCRGAIEFRDVSFTYGEADVLNDINIKIEPGSTVAIMGATGAGKSSLIQLIPRFYDCNSGAVLVDGIDVRKLDYNDLRRNVGLIFQDTFLFSDTIAANIAFEKPNASQEEIERAAKAADAHEFIIKTPNGYDTVIGERGVGLSGGQRQRVAIARAILTNPKILILDDATSSVDMETEHEIQQTLEGLMQERTTLVVAHRISSVRNADEIIVLDHGRIVERGTHEELVELEGKYYQTFIEQYSEFKDSDLGYKLVAGGEI